MIEITISGLKEVRSKLDQLSKSLDTTEILDESEAILLNRIRTRFLAETDPDGQKWTPSRRALKTGGKTLFKTGKLFHSLQAYAKGLDTRGIGTDIPYAAKHQFGEGGLPVRAFLGFNDEDLMIVEKRVLQRITEALA